MRSLSLLLPALLFTTAAAFSQPIGFGIKGGMPMTDFVNAASSGRFNASTVTNRYIVGPTVELRLPFGLGIEADVLYRHFSYRSNGLASVGSSIAADTSTGAWEFPLLAKYRFKGKLVRPYVDAGVSWDKLSGVTQAVKSIVNNVTTTSTSSNPFELRNDVTRGFVMGAGLDIKLLVLHVSPEVRFTRWGAKHFIDPAGIIDSKQNQAEFLVGITF
jgi:opacity protein-like surface antigen